MEYSDTALQKNTLPGGPDLTLENLSHKDAIDLLEYLNGILSCKTEEELEAHVLGLSRLVSFEYSVYGRGRINQLYTSQDPTYHVKNISYPESYLQRYLSKGYHFIDPVLAELGKTRQLQNWEEVHNRCHDGQKNRVYREAEESGLKDGFTHGIADLKERHMSIFYFGGVYIENNRQTRTILNCAVPFLCEKLNSLLIYKKPIPYKLTGREREVLKWLKEGKTSWEIGRLFNISERGVNFHVNNIIHKLNATNRIHAVAIALENELIDF